MTKSTYCRTQMWETYLKPKLAHHAHSHPSQFDHSYICWWHCITALPPISLIQNLCDQNQSIQCQIACTVKQFMVIGIPEVLSQSLPSFRHKLSVVYMNLKMQQSRTYWSKVWIQLIPKFIIYVLFIIRPSLQQKSCPGQNCSLFHKEKLG